MSLERKSFIIHAAVIIALALSYFVLPEYHSGNLARIMVLSIYAMGYNLAFGYTGLLSLGHAMFFAAGMYGLGLAVQMEFLPAGPALLFGVLCAAIVAMIVGFLALRTTGVAFMIVTLMFAQSAFLATFLAGKYTRGDEGFVLAQPTRAIFGIDLSDSTNRYFAAFILTAACLSGLAWLVRSNFGRALVAIRENEERARMIGYNVQRYKLYSLIISGALSGLGGASYALLFGYVGSTFASVQYSILPLLWVLLGGAGTTIGPLVGTIFMFYLIDISSEFTDAYMLVAGAVLILLTLFAPEGLVGELRRRFAPWLP